MCSEAAPKETTRGTSLPLELFFRVGLDIKQINSNVKVVEQKVM